MKQYIDGIKDEGWKAQIEKEHRLILIGFRMMRNKIWGVADTPVKHIPVTYYKPLTLYPKNGGSMLLAEMDNIDKLKWVDGEPYELVVL